MTPSAVPSADATAPGRADPLGMRGLAADSRGGRRLERLLVLLVFFVEGGAPAPHVNETHYITKAKHYWDPEFCPGDAFLDSADPHWLFYATVGALTQVCELPTVAWIGRLLAWGSLAAGWLALTRAIGLPRGAAVVAAALFVALVERGNFAGEWVVGGVEAKCFAYALALCGLSRLVQGRYAPMWLAGGTAAAWHVVVGGWTVVAGALVWLTEPRATRPALRSMAPALVAGGALACLGLVPALLLDAEATPAERNEAAQIYVFRRLPHHLAPLALKTEELHRRAARFALVLVAAALLWRWQRTAPDEVRPWADRGALERLFRFAVAALALAGVGLLIQAGFPDRPALAARWLRFYWFRLADVAVPLVASVTVVAWAAAGLASGRRGRQIVALAPLLFCGWHLLARSAERWHRPWPPGDARTASLDAWREACEWIRRHAPPDALCLTSRDAQTFRWYARRGDVANWKDLPQDAAAVVEWYRRCQTIWSYVADDGTTGHASLAALGTSRALDAAWRYRASLIVTASDPPLQLPAAFVNERYAVYRVPPPPAPLAP